jgi:sialate O-acetylesterase
MLLATVPLHAEVKVPAAISSHMVLQREMPVPIWGTAAKDEKITVKFREQSVSTTADEQGNWRVKLAALKAGGPDKLTISGTNTIEIEDVLVGEVWVGSGQSNMAGGVKGYAKGDELLAKQAAAAPYARLRLLKSNGKWQEASEENVSNFSAILFSFGLRLQADLDVPVGLMLGAVGGTPSGYWLSEEAFKNDAAIQGSIAQALKGFDEAAEQKKYEAALAKHAEQAAAAKAAGKKEPPKPQINKPGEVRGKVGHLYEAHIRPFVTYGIRGVLWDQGESGTAVQSVDQFTLMGGLFQGWRKEWGQNDFPFIYVQKPSGGGCAFDPTNPTTIRGEKFSPLPSAVPSDGQYRELHIRIMQHANVGMTISSDLGSGIHPANKSGYAERASRVALGMVYGKKVEYYGPTYASHQVNEGKVTLAFKHVGQGLTHKHGEKLQGFAVAGADKIFHWADAEIKGETVVLSSSKVPQPVAVRYAYASQHTWANLFNQDGLPAIPFRTDNW